MAHCYTQEIVVQSMSIGNLAKSIAEEGRESNGYRT